MTNKIVVLIMIAVFSFSCGRSQPEPNPIISTDFQDMEFPAEPVFVAMVKLKEPALLSSAVRDEKGKYKVDAALKARILAEQDQMLETLKTLSPKIKVIYSYKMVLNALALEAPQDLVDEIANLNADFIEADERFAMPTALEKNKSVKALEASLAKKNSMTFIGVDKVRSNLSVEDENGKKVSVLGQGVKIGIIDTGIDYTHKMLGGSGDVGAFNAMDANSASSLFPNKKVVGGKDFVGETYSPGNHIYQSRIPRPDDNPIDRGGHGTHVAGTAAGLGDGVNTYDGAAPGADLYALKVFGDNGGGTSDTVVIAALEYAADPNGDLDPSDKLDVVNLSLGGGFGKPHNLYGVAIDNLAKGGVLAVAAAGNSGPVSNIVGAPSTAAAALSVAASVDDLSQNIESNGAEFTSEAFDDLFVEAIEGAITKSLDEVSNIKQDMVYIGLADKALTLEQTEALKGKIALIDRGAVAFTEKVGRAQAAGAIGVVVANNQPGAPIVMGGEGSFEIPGVMITQAVGEQIKRAMASQSVSVNLTPGKKIRKEELIDTLAGFSSQGPRDLDALIKPEISAPGQAVISASVGTGSEGVMLGGTSMASPHVAGVAALLVQYRRDLEPSELKAVLMNSSILISDEASSVYPISRQGAGRIRAFDALESTVVFSKPALSLGKVAIDRSLTKTESVVVKNFGDSEAVFSLSVKNGQHLRLSLSERRLSLSPGEEVEVAVSATMTVPQNSEVVEEDAFVEIVSNGKVQGQIPVLAVINRNSLLSPVVLKVNAASKEVSAGAVVEASFLNQSDNVGVAFLFNKLGEDKRKAETADRSLSFACDLESAGYRVVSIEGRPHLEVATKIYNPVSSWETCDINVEVDLDGDGQADKTVYGSNPNGFPGLRDNPQLAGLGLSSLIFDTKRLNELLVANEEAVAEQNATPPSLSFLPALEGVSSMANFRHSTLGIVAIPLELFSGAESTQIKVSVSFNGGDVQERNDELADAGSVWKTVELGDGAGFVEMPGLVAVRPGAIQTVQFVKGRNQSGEMIAYFPRNEFNLLRTGRGKQAAVMNVVYGQTPSLP